MTMMRGLAFLVLESSCLADCIVKISDSLWCGRQECLRARTRTCTRAPRPTPAHAHARPRPPTPAHARPRTPTHAHARPRTPTHARTRQVGRSHGWIQVVPNKLCQQQHLHPQPPLRQPGVGGKDPSIMALNFYKNPGTRKNKSECKTKVSSPKYVDAMRNQARENNVTRKHPKYIHSKKTRQAIVAVRPAICVGTVQTTFCSHCLCIFVTCLPESHIWCTYPCTFLAQFRSIFSTFQNHIFGSCTFLFTFLEARNFFPKVDGPRNPLGNVGGPLGHLRLRRSRTCAPR